MKPESCGQCACRYLCSEANRGKDIRCCIVDDGKAIQSKRSGGL